MNFIQSTRQCLICERKFHQIDTTQERAQMVTHRALLKHQQDDHRDVHELMAELCTCGMAEQERTGHYPEHQDWCDVPSPLDEEVSA